MRKELIENIAGFIVKKVQKESNESGFQLIVSNEEIEKEFIIKVDKQMQQEIEEYLYSKEEVADVQIDKVGFDVVIFTEFAPHYDASQYENFYEISYEVA